LLTLVVCCSDDGELAGEHGCWWKGISQWGKKTQPFCADRMKVPRPSYEAEVELL